MASPVVEWNATLMSSSDTINIFSSIWDLQDTSQWNRPHQKVLRTSRQPRKRLWDKKETQNNYSLLSYYSEFIFCLINVYEVPTEAFTRILVSYSDDNLSWYNLSLLLYDKFPSISSQEIIIITSKVNIAEHRNQPRPIIQSSICRRSIFRDIQRVQSNQYNH